jgi:hypothetical protein
MRPLKIVFLVFILVISYSGSFAQVIDRPNQALKSPEPLSLQKIETAAGKTVFYFTLVNQVKDGYFCAEKNIFLVFPDGTRSKLIGADGIPVCPAYHKFSSPGERLDFKLVFSEIPADLKWLDLVEECESGCITFYGITLDRELNTRLDDLFQKAEKTTPEASIPLFKAMIDELDSRNLGIEGLLYLNIINASLEANDRIGAAVWYKRLLVSGAPRLSYYIKFLNDKGVRF